MGTSLRTSRKVSRFYRRFRPPEARPRPSRELAQGETVHRWPQILPGGKAVLFTANIVSSNFDGADIEVMSLADHRRKTLVTRRYIWPLLAKRPSALHQPGYAVCRAVRLESSGGPRHARPSTRGRRLQHLGRIRAARFVSGAERLSTVVAKEADCLRCNGSTPRDKTQPLLAKPGVYGRPSLSPDGRRLALEVAEGQKTSVVYDWNVTL